MSSRSVELLSSMMFEFGRRHHPYQSVGVVRNQVRAGLMRGLSVLQSQKLQPCDENLGLSCQHCQL